MLYKKIKKITNDKKIFAVKSDDLDNNKKKQSKNLEKANVLNDHNRQDLDPNADIKIYYANHNLLSLQNEVFLDQNFGLIIAKFNVQELKNVINFLKIANSNFANLVFFKIVDCQYYQDLILDLFELLNCSRISILDISQTKVDYKILQNNSVLEIYKLPINFTNSKNSNILNHQYIQKLFNNKIIEIRCDQEYIDLLENKKSKSNNLNQLNSIRNQYFLNNITPLQFDNSVPLIDQQILTENESLEINNSDLKNNLNSTKHNLDNNLKYELFAFQIAQKFEENTPDYRQEILDKIKKFSKIS